MRTAAYMTAGCVAGWIAASLIAPDASVAVLLGLAAPLVVAVGTMAAAERTFTRDPQRLTSLMIKAFGLKLVGFGAYVAMVVGLAPVDPIVFVASFVISFIALHLTEAMWLKGLFQTAMS